ncbi:MAG TPA: PQQ-dependent sugar dehydrogenase [Tepidisphaeraceae bacterium]|jgi:putative heme-binding domain-containing protein
MSTGQRWRRMAWFLVALFAAGLFDVGLLPARARAAELDHRPPWTGGHVHGSPQPPAPFELQRIFPKLKFAEPLDIDFEAGGTGRILVAEKGGKVFSFPNRPDVDHADRLVDLREVVDWKQVPNCRGFDSLYGIVLHPKFEENHYLYVCYALDFSPRRPEPVGTRVSRFVVAGEPPRIDPKSEKILIEWQAGGHNGGCIKFGKDGYLYISTGDQSDPNPPDMYKTGQDISDLRASILRIDVDHPDGDRPYSIPRDNPFVGRPGARGEVWCYGLRNPWRMSFDRVTGRLWVADVGWELWESVLCATAGGNYGWSIMEGPNPVNIALPRGPTPIIPPLLALSHAESASITGGIVYRGKRNPQLAGNYIFGDWETRRLWAAKLIGQDKLEPHRTIAQTDQRIVVFGEDAQGELYVIDHEGGGIYSIVPNDAARNASVFPHTLKETGIFADVAAQKPAPGVLPFAIKAPQWVDGATAQRFVAVPGEGVIRWRTDDVYARLQRNFPTDSVLVRTLSLEMSAGDPRSSRKIETQLLHFDAKQWQAYTYRWREDQSDADLVNEGGAEQRLTISDPAAPGGKREQTWRFGSRAQCLTCHSSWSAYTLAFTDEQIDCPLQYAGTDAPENQLAALRRIGFLPPPYKEVKGGPGTPPKYSLVDPYDSSAALAERARSYLHVNCSVCHRMGGGGSALIDLRREMNPAQTRAIDQRPMLGAFGIDDPRIIAPGDPGRSVLLYRLAKIGSGHMPKIGSERIDPRAVAMIGDWIASMASGTPAEKSLSSTRGALALVHQLDRGGMPDATRKQAIARGLASPQIEVRDLFEGFPEAGTQRPRLGPGFDRNKLLATSGDANRGRDVFQTIAQCSTCHTATGTTGREFGPDLSHIATKFPTRAQLLENVTEPSKTIEQGYTGYNVTTTDGDVLSGFIITRNATETVIKDSTQQLTHIPAAQVKGVSPQTLSIMPEGLLDNLEPQQAADLLEWLATLK